MAEGLGATWLVEETKVCVNGAFNTPNNNSPTSTIDVNFERLMMY